MKAPEVIEQLIKRAVLELIASQKGTPNPLPLQEGWEKLIKGKG